MNPSSALGVACTIGYLTNATPVTVCDTCAALVLVEDIERHYGWHEDQHP